MEEGSDDQTNVTKAELDQARKHLEDSFAKRQKAYFEDVAEIRGNFSAEIKAGYINKWEWVVGIVATFIVAATILGAAAMIFLPSLSAPQLPTIAKHVVPDKAVPPQSVGSTDESHKDSACCAGDIWGYLAPFISRKDNGQADYMKIFIPIIALLFAGAVGALGLTRLKQFDQEINTVRSDLSRQLLEERKLSIDDRKTFRDDVQSSVNTRIDAIAETLPGKVDAKIETTINEFTEKTETQIEEFQKKTGTSL